MKNKFAAVCSAVCLVFASFAPAVGADGRQTVKIGDYIRMGAYYDEPMLWRCVDTDGNGALMLADKIICFKAYDANGGANTETGSHSRSDRRAYMPSNYWADSNIRSWLNSGAAAGEVEWSCGNPPDNAHLTFGNAYDNEAGFLTCFTPTERTAIKAVTQKSIVSACDITGSVSGTEVYSYNYNISDVVQNYDSAYSEQTEDKIFLLDVQQVNAVYKNSAALGGEYYIGYPTDKAVENIEQAGAQTAKGEKCRYWLRTPYCPQYDDGGTEARAVYPEGHIGSGNASYSNNYGVRPAFYLDGRVNLTGSGTADEPYELHPLSVTDAEGNIIDSVPAGVSFSVSCDTRRMLEGADGGGVLIIAVYDKSGAVMRVSSRDISVTDDGCKLSFTALDRDAGRVKAFIWNSLDMMDPIIESETTIL